MDAIKNESFSVNGCTYRPSPRPVVVICVDGCADEYLSVSLAQGRMPALAQITRNGYRGMARGALPSFTNVNNAAIATGVPPSTTGISGNFFLDPESGEEVMMNDPRFLRCGTIFAEAARADRKVAVVTAKDKLREILGKDLNGIAFSAEKAHAADVKTHGIANLESIVGRCSPDIYSGDASVYVLEAGAALIEQGLADFLYLSLTDYMQHAYAPQTQESLDFHAQLDQQLARLVKANAVIGITADHGMNAKQHPDGSAKVIYLEQELVKKFGDNCKVICPITDPYVVHHGALGALVMVHATDKTLLPKIETWLRHHDGITEVFDRALAVKKLELPGDRIGDLVVLAGRDWVIGRKPQDHDLSVLKGGLRSHGGRYEEMVPLIFSEPLNDEYAARAAGDPRNFEIFEFTCNGGSK